MLKFGWNRTANIKKKQKMLQTSFQFFIIPTSDNTLLLFGHNITIQVLHEFMTFALSSTHTTAVSPADVGGTIVTLAWLDVFIKTTVSSLSAGGSINVGENRLKLYHNTSFA